MIDDADELDLQDDPPENWDHVVRDRAEPNWRYMRVSVKPGACAEDTEPRGRRYTSPGAAMVAAPPPDDTYRIIGIREGQGTWGKEDIRASAVRSGSTICWEAKIEAMPAIRPRGHAFMDKEDEEYR